MRTDRASAYPDGVSDALLTPPKSPKPDDLGALFGWCRGAGCCQQFRSILGPFYYARIGPMKWLHRLLGLHEHQWRALGGKELVRIGGRLEWRWTHSCVVPRCNKVKTTYRAVDLNQLVTFGDDVSKIMVRNRR